MTKGGALQRAVQTLETSDQTRARYEALCGLYLCYAYGEQWASVGTGGRGGFAVNQLRNFIQPNSRKVRLAMNFIRSRITKLNSRIMPRQIPYRVKPVSRAANDAVAALVADARLKQQISSTRAVGTLRRAHLIRMVLGSSVVRRTINQSGPPITVRTADGQPSMNKDGRPRMLKTYSNDWAACFPWEFIRDPSAQTTDFEDEEIIGHEKAMPADWVNRHFETSIKSDATMGKLMECQRFLHSAIGNTTLTRGVEDSKMPGVMFSEWWLKDDSSGSANPWPWHLICWRDTCGQTPDERTLKVLQFGPNPYWGLPLHHFTYDTELTSPWACGVPALCIPAQDASNLAITSVLRTLINHGNPTWLAEANSTTEPLQYALMNQTNKPIEYHRGATPPTRLASAPLDQVSAHIMASTSGWLDDMLTMAPVQSGEAVSRGEAARAYEVRRDAADTPITAVIDGDRLIMQDLLAGTMHDIIKTDSEEVLVQRLSHQFTPRQIMTLKQQDSTKLLSGVEIDVDKLKPRTPQEAREDAAASINTKMLDPVSARRSLWIREGIVVDEKEAQAMQMQQQEIASMLMGEQVEVYPGQSHEAHKYMLSFEMDSPRWSQYTQEQRDTINEHDRLHDEAMRMMAQVSASLDPQQMGQMDQEQELMGGFEEEQPTSDLVGQQPPPQLAQPQLAISGQGGPSELPPGMSQGLEGLPSNALIGAGLQGVA